MKRGLICGLVLVSMFVLAASAEAGNVRFSFGFGYGGFGFGMGYSTGYYQPYPVRPIYAYRPYTYYGGYAAYPYAAAPYYYPAPSYYYRPYYVAPRVRYYVPARPYGMYRAQEPRPDRVYSDYVPRRYGRVW